MKFLILSLLILTSCTVDKKLTEEENELVGVWQAIPEVASGWANTYQFFDNGEFKFNFSQMICDNRTLDYSGTWELIGKDKLKLTIKAKTILEGGKLVPAMGSCGSDYEIEGGEVKNVKLAKLEIQDIQLSSTIIDKDNLELKTRRLSGKSFWKFDEDPNKYN